MLEVKQSSECGVWNEKKSSKLGISFGSKSSFYLNFGIFMANKIEIREKLIPLMLPNMIIVSVDIMMVKAANKLFATLQGKFNDTSTSFGIKTFHAGGAQLFVLHTEPLQNADTSSDAVIIDKGQFLFIVGQL